MKSVESTYNPLNCYVYYDVGSSDAVFLERDGKKIPYKDLQ